MLDYEALFRDLASLGFEVRGLRQTHDSKWEAQLHLAHEGRMLDRFSLGRSPFEALVNCTRDIEWAKANPPKPASFAKGSLDELLSIARAAPAYSALSSADVKSLKL